MQQFNDTQASMNKSGNLSLGSSGQDDAAGHGTYGYAKNDVTLTVPANLITSDTLPALTYATGDIPIRALAASTTHKVTVPMPQLFNRSFSGVANALANGSAPHGILVKSLAFAYRVNTTTITSITGAILRAPLVAASALPTVVAPAVTVAGGTLTAAANVYLLTVTVDTPAFVTTNDMLWWGLVTVVVPGSSTVDILGASWRVAYAMY